MERAATVLTSVFLVLVVGCAAGVVSGKFRKEAGGGVPVRDLFMEPDSFRDRAVILGGTVVNTTGAEGGSYIEVIERPLDYYERPDGSGVSRGRFIVFNKGRAGYPRGSDITVAGHVAGSIVRDRAGAEIEFLLIRSREIHAFRPRGGFEFRFGLGTFHTGD
jgi:starvation-inducible outer membrane lipoprotein